MNQKPAYKIHPSFQRQQSEQDGMVYQATYVIEDAGGVCGEPVIVSGTFASAEEAMDAARGAGDKVLSQLN